MQNGSHGEKEKSRESKAKDMMVEIERDKLSRNVSTRGDRILKGKNGLPDEWDKTAEMLRKTAETILGVTFGKRKETGRHGGGMRKFRRA